ncbi:nuclear transport factor 2 family protein [Chitinophaga sp. G-6-1-13]|uniref:Nuclear transport factor 2 family protein n=1 Tax=Chitinophaga fulva TaxID=2728842 RepID=A0A848GKM0_9BACT|nr:nuclear transport factor 2 family protein [Chitinophaga fulva]NML37250.1 nuclear transport factor 2 family protein [Chitinophaga fulva]
MERFDRNTPVGMVSYFRHCIKTGDVKGAMSCFDAQGVYIDRTGIAIRGLQQIEAAIGHLCAWRPDIKGATPHVTMLDNLAVWLDKWKMTGTTPDGHPISMDGHTTCLMKKDERGIWLWLVDNPFGAAVLDV